MSAGCWTQNMERNQGNGIADNGDKSLAEWPTLGDVCSNTKQPSQNGGVARNSKIDPKRTNSPPNKTEGDDSAKENEDSAGHSNNRGSKKKPKWVPVEIPTQPYRKRFDRSNSRSSYEQNRTYANSNGNYDKKNENSDNTNGYENSSRGNRGTSRFRGKKIRGFSNNVRQHQEEKASGESETTDENKEKVSDVDYFQTVLYYDPHTHNRYASVTRRNELKRAIRNQIEYYFSEENLIKDFFMRRKMDANGYVPLTLVAGFHRVHSLTHDFETIVEAIQESDKLEVADNTKVRPIVDPLKWPLPDLCNLRPDVPDFVPGQPYFSLSSVIEGIQNINFYYPDNMDPNQHFSNGVDATENPFENISQMAQVEATS